MRKKAVTSHGVGSFLEAPRWNKAFVPFGDRLSFLSPEARHCATGKLRILPPRQDRKRDRVPA